MVYLDILCQNKFHDYLLYFSGMNEFRGVAWKIRCKIDS